MEEALKCEWTLSGSKAQYWPRRRSSRGYARSLHGTVFDPPDHCSTFKKIKIFSLKIRKKNRIQILPDMIDGMKSSKLREKSSVGNIITYIFPAIDALGPVVSPIVHTSRFESVRPHIINVSARPFIGHGPIRKGFHKFRFLSFHQLPAFLFFGGKFLVIF